MRRRRSRRPPLTDFERRATIGPRILKRRDTAEYAWQTCELIKLYWQGRQVEAQRWDDLLAEAERDRIFDRLPPPPATPYGSLDAMLRGELGITRESARETIRERAVALAADPALPPLAHAGGDRRSARVRTDQGSDDILKGRGAAYLVRRLKRDAPAIAKALARGEYKSARAAALAAGILHAPTALDQLRRAWRAATPAERRAFKAEIRRAK